MKNFELEKMDVEEMDIEEKKNVDGGDGVLDTLLDGVKWNLKAIAFGLALLASD